MATKGNISFNSQDYRDFAARFLSEHGYSPDALDEMLQPDVPEQPDQDEQHFIAKDLSAAYLSDSILVYASLDLVNRQRSIIQSLSTSLGFAFSQIQQLCAVLSDLSDGVQPKDPDDDDDPLGDDAFGDMTGGDTGDGIEDGNQNTGSVDPADLTSHMVTFLNWDGTTISSATVEYGTTAEAPAVDSILPKTGYRFTRWSPSIQNVTADITATAQYEACQYNVQFYLDEGSCDIDHKLVTYDAQYGELPVPACVGKTFVGWLNDNYDGKVISSTIVAIAEDHMLSAQWTEMSENYHTVTFVDDDGNTIDTVEVVDGTTAEAPYDEGIPAKTGYRFTGWSPSIQNVTTDITAIAQYEACTYTVVFDADGGTCSESQRTVTFDQPYGQMPEPEYDENAFTGWFDADGNEVLSSTVVSIANDHTLTAHWEDGTSGGGDDEPEDDDVDPLGDDAFADFSRDDIENDDFANVYQNAYNNMFNYDALSQL